MTRFRSRARPIARADADRPARRANGADAMMQCENRVVYY